MGRTQQQGRVAAVEDVLPEEMNVQIELVVGSVDWTSLHWDRPFEGWARVNDEIELEGKVSCNHTQTHPKGMMVRE